MTLVLGIETSSPKGSVAICDGKRLLTSAKFRTDRAHAKELLPAIKSLLNEQRATFSSLSLVAVDRGPGSFTGLRIGVVCAKFISYFASVPIVGVVSTDSIAEAYATNEKGDGRLVVLLDAYRGMLYSAVYEEGTKRTLLDVLPPDEVDRYIGSDAVLCGYGLKRYKEMLIKGGRRVAEDYDYPDAYYVATVGLRRFREEGADDSETLAPLYLRLSEAEERRGVVKRPDELELE